MVILKIVFSILILLSLSSFVCADFLVHQTPETQGFTSTTNVISEGRATESDSLICQGSTYALDNSLSSLTFTPWNFGDLIEGVKYFWTIVHLPEGTWAATHADTPNTPIDEGDVYGWDLTGYVPSFNKMPGEIQYITSYNEDTLADSGQVSYTKSLTIDTQNQVANQNNFKTEKIVNFLGDENGLITSDESLFLNTAGQYGWSDNLHNCPFGVGINNVTPQFCNSEERGSLVRMKQMTMTGSASDRFIAGFVDVPISMNYDIAFTGVVDSPAIGSATAYINVHSTEGRIMKMFGHSYRPGQASDIVYNEETTSSGEIFKFQKQMSYISGYSRVK